MHKKLPVSSVVALSAAVAAFQAHAVDPAVVKAGVFDLKPTLTLDQRYDDNIFSQPEDEKESWVTVLTPAVSAEADLGTVAVQLGYQHAAGIFEASNADNFNDNRANGLVSWELNHRNQLDLSAIYNDGHEDRGTGLSQGAGAQGITSPDTYEELTYDAKYTFGSETSTGRLVLNLTDYSKEYTNNRDTTRGRDREDLTVGATFFWRVAGATDLLLEAKQADIEYVNDPNVVVGGFDTLDSTATKFLAGVTWEATAKTTGTIKVGQARKDFDDNDRDDFSGSSWEAEVQWSPLTHSVLTLNTSREPRETSGAGSFIDAESYGVNWQHSWANNITSNVYYNYSEEAYKGAPEKREDEMTSYGLRVDYSMRRWLDLGFSVGYSEKDSTSSTFEYKRNQAALHLTVSL